MFGDRMSSREFNSPESTVTSLLASSGHLRSSFDPEPSLTFRYRDSRFESASAALDAYIEDFERKRSPTISHLLTDQCARVRNRDVLRDQLTDAELDFLTLPVGLHPPDMDRLSVTTDDLLVLPCNGSLPITRTSAFLTQSGGQSRSFSLSQHAHSHSSNHRPRRGSADTARAQRPASSDLLQPRQQSKRPPTLATSTGRALKSSQKPHQALNQTSLPPSPRRCYPRWMTSQKAEMAMSGISSIPDLRYPAWIQECGLPLDAHAWKPSYEEAAASRQSRPRSPKVPYWLGELEGSYERLQKGGVGHFGAGSDPGDLLGDSEARFKTPRHRLFQTSEGDSRDMDDLFRDDGLERLILKAETVLSSPSLGRSSPSLGRSSPSLGRTSPSLGQGSPSLGQGSPSLGQGSPSLGQGSPSLGRSSPSLALSSLSLGVIGPRQADLDQADSSGDSLEADRSWDNPAVTFKSPVPVGGAESPVMADTPFEERNESKGSCSSGYSSRKAPGPVEALKQMLFSLQAVEQQISQPSEDRGPDTAASDTRRKGDGWTEKNAEIAVMSGTGVERYETPGGQSLQRALHHLGRLKSLVEDLHEKTPEVNTS